jgi:hypothetical protein
MAVLRKAAPTDVAAAFAKQLPDFVSLPSDSSRRMQGFVGSPPAIPTMDDLGPPGDRILRHDGQEVFVLSLTDAAYNGGVSAAVSSGWRFFAGSAPGKILMGKVARRKVSDWKLTAAFYGDRVWAANEASKALDRLPEVQSSDYELRVLTVPGLNLEVFWLVAQSASADDLVVPFPMKPHQPIDVLNQDAVFTMANFLAAIRPLARLQMTAEPLHGS